MLAQRRKGRYFKCSAKSSNKHSCDQTPSANRYKTWFMQQNVTPSSFAAASCHRQSTLHLKPRWEDRLREELMVQEQPENQTDNFTFERSCPRKSATTELKSGYLCNKNPCHGVKRWKKPLVWVEFHHLQDNPWLWGATCCRHIIVLSFHLWPFFCPPWGL